MKVKCQTIRELVKEMEEKGESKQQMEDKFKEALKAKLIDVHDFYNAMKLIYK